MVVRASGGEAFAEGYAAVGDGTVAGVVMMHGRDPVTGNGRGMTAMGFVLPGGGLAVGRLYGPDGTELAEKFGGMMYRHNLAAMCGVMFAPEGAGGRMDGRVSPDPRILPDRVDILDSAQILDSAYEREQVRDGGRTRVPDRNETPARMPVAGRLTVAFDPLCPFSRRLMASPAVSDLERAGTEIVWAPVNVLQGSLGHGEFFLREGRLAESAAEASGDISFWERADGAALAVPGIIPEGEWFGPSAVLENTWRFRSLMGAGAEPVSPVLMWTEGGSLRTRTGVPLPGELDPGRMDPAGSPAAVAHGGPDAGFTSVWSGGADVSQSPGLAEGADVSPVSFRQTETDVSRAPSGVTDIVAGGSARRLIIGEVTASAPVVSGITDVSQKANQFAIAKDGFFGESVLSGNQPEDGSGLFPALIISSGSVISDRIVHDSSSGDHFGSVAAERFNSGCPITVRFPLETSSGIPSDVPVGPNSGHHSVIPADGSGSAGRPRDTECAERHILASMGVRTAGGDIFEDCPALKGSADASGAFEGVPPGTSVLSGEAALPDGRVSADGLGSGEARVSGDKLPRLLPDTESAAHEDMSGSGGAASDGFVNTADGGGRRSGTS
jgi:hypothetical protein